jgi:hypothetical protein
MNAYLISVVYSISTFLWKTATRAALDHPTLPA